MLRDVIHLQVLNNHKTMSFVTKKSLSIFFGQQKTVKPLPSPFFFKQRCDTVGWLVATVDAWMAGAA